MSGGLDLVTGGAGFIGSHLARALLAAGRRVRVLDDLSTGRRANLAEGVEFIEGEAAATAGRAVEGVEVVYHLAAIPSVPRSVERPLESYRANVTATRAVLDAAARAGVRRLVFASSSSVYGDAATLPKREDLPPNPLSPYAVAKLAGELYVRAAAAHSPLETVSLRFFNVYGPRQDPDSPYAAVIPIFLRRLREGRPLPVTGDGAQTRDFTFVGDVVQGIIGAAGATGVSGRVYNLAGGRAITVRELAETLARLAGARVEIEFVPPRPGDIRDSWADVSAARGDLGFEARTSLEDGLRRTLDGSRT
jgi:UDP-glucose 4-epimerase